MTPRLIRFARAIQEFEGWNYGATAERPLLYPSITWKNHNPGALRSSPFQAGTRDGFAYFCDDEIGFFALIWDLWMKCQGKTSTGLNGESTIYDLIKIYSAEPKPKVDEYAKFIQERTGLGPNTKLKILLQ